MQWFGKFGEQFLERGGGGPSHGHTSFGARRQVPPGGSLEGEGEGEGGLAPWGCGGSMWGHGCAERRSLIALLSKVSWSWPVRE